MFKKHHPRWLLCACKWFNQHVTSSFFPNCFYSGSHKNTFLFLSQSALIWLDCMFDRLLCLYLWFCHNSTEFFKKNVQNPTLYKLICWVVWARVHQTSMVLTNDIVTKKRWASEARECPFLAKMLQGRWKVKTWKMLTWPKVHLYLLFMPDPVVFLSFPYVTLYCHSLDVSLSNWSPSPLPPIKQDVSQGLGLVISADTLPWPQ